MSQSETQVKAAPPSSRASDGWPLLPYRSAQRLEIALGDSRVEGNLFSHKQTMLADEDEHYPQAAIDFLNAARLNHFYVPTAWGGRMANAEELLALHRVLARRDLTVNSSYSVFAWSCSVWIAGTAAQKKRVAAKVLSGTSPCLAYTEKPHGADLLAGDLWAQRLPHGDYQLNGEKWAVNSATRSEMVNLLAKTGEGQGPRGLSAFWIDKQDLETHCYHHLPKVRTLGLRGLDLSGIAFKDAVVRGDTMLGNEGEGLEVALKTLQVTRTFCSSFSLGAGDSMLRLATEFASERALYGKHAIDIPSVRGLLANSYVNLLAAECVALASARGIQCFPDQFSAWSAVVKVQVPALVEQLAQATAQVLGARFFMREQHEHGVFQKFFRDHLIVSVFDGSTAVCLDSLRLQLRGMVMERQRRGGKTSVATLSTLYEIGRPLPAWEFDRMRVLTRGQDVVTASLPMLVQRLHALRPDESLDAATLDSLKSLGARLQVHQQDLDHDVMMHFEQPGNEGEASLLLKARQHCQLHAAVVSLGFWLCNRERLRPGLRGGEWLAALLSRRGNPEFQHLTLAEPLKERVLADLLDSVKANRMLSLIDFELAAPGSAQQPVTL